MATAGYPAPPAGYVASGSGRLRRERSRLGPITLASALLAVGGAALLNNIGLTSLTGGQLGALALIVLGAGLVVGAWWGRARWLTFIGLLLLPFVAPWGQDHPTAAAPHDGETVPAEAA